MGREPKLHQGLFTKKIFLYFFSIHSPAAGTTRYTPIQPQLNTHQNTYNVMALAKVMVLAKDQQELPDKRSIFGVLIWILPLPFKQMVELHLQEPIPRVTFGTYKLAHRVGNGLVGGMQTLEIER